MAYLLFDIGGTKMRIAFSRDGKRFFNSKIIATPKTYKDGILALKEIAKDSGVKKIKAVVGGLAGSFDRSKSRIIGGGSNIKGWIGKNLKKEFQLAFGAPVYLENDAALAGLAEATRGAGKGKEIVVYFTVSTGFGGARITKGKIDESARGFEPTYQIVDASTEMKRGYPAGRIDAYISGRGIETRYHKKPEEITNRQVGDELARWLAIALNNAIVHWSPDIVVLGGPVMNIISMSRVRLHLRKIYKGYIAPPPIVRAELGDQGGLWGAMTFLKQKLGA